MQCTQDVCGCEQPVPKEVKTDVLPAIINTEFDTVQAAVILNETVN